ncbi:MAG: rhomboid family intramembrane serine protease [Candidatus Hadarchaeales archaeon]
MFPLKDENPSRRRPVVTWALIIINFAIFTGGWAAGVFEQTIEEFGMKPVEIVGGRNLHTLITSMFLHGGILHIAGNMLYLWIFGDNVEDLLGRGKFILFYIMCGLAADGFHILSDPSSPISTIGASGAISGVLGAYAVIYPRAKVHTLLMLGYFWHVVMIPAVAFLGFWFIFQIFLASIMWISAASSGVAYFAHIGGFIAGVIVALIFWMRKKSRWVCTMKFTTYC